jgi:hypothetical protein
VTATRAVSGAACVGGDVAPPALWFGLFGAPAAWSVQLLVNYALVAHACFPKSEPLASPALGGLHAIVLGTSFAALAIALAAAVTAGRSLRGSRHESHGGNGALLEVGEGRTGFMALAGVLVSGVFLLGIAMNAIPLFLVSPCGLA